MSAFISSAVSGKKVAPKAPARRRAVPPPPPSPRRPPPGNEPEPEPARESTPAAPPSPPSTQVRTDDIPVEPPVQPQSQPQSQSQSQTQSRPESPSASAAIETHSQAEALQESRLPTSESPHNEADIDHAQPQLSSTDPSTPASTVETTAPSGDGSTSETPASSKRARPASKKRQLQEEAAPPPKPAKRAKRSSARSNAAVQTRFTESEPSVPAVQDTAPPESPSATQAQDYTAVTDPLPTKKTSKAPPKRKIAQRKPAKSAATVPRDADDGEPGDSTVEPQPAAEGSDTPAQDVVPDAEDEAQQGAGPLLEQVAASIETTNPRKGSATKKASTATKAVTKAKKATSAAKSAAKPKKAPAKKKQSRRTKTPNELPQEDEQIGEGVPAGDEDDDGGSSDPEAHEIDPTTLSMFELSHDARHGKVSEREKKMAEIDWDEVAQKRREAIERVMAGEQAETEGQKDAVDGDAVETIEEPKDGSKSKPKAKSKTRSKSKSPREKPAGSEQPEGGPEDQDDAGADAEAGAEAEPEAGADADFGTSGGPSFRIVNGQIVVDEDSLTTNRQAETDAALNNDEPVEEENDLTVRINRATWVNDRRREPTERIPMWRSKSDPWSDADTDKFYDALKMFGTDFFIISKMFAPRTRKQIKLKFVREEKFDPVRINKALMGIATAMDLNHYAKESGRDVSVFTKFESFEQAEEVIRASMKDKEAAMQEAIAEETENARQAEIAMGQKEKQKAAAEKKRKEKREAKKRAKGMGAGTMGGAVEEESAAVGDAEGGDEAEGG